MEFTITQELAQSILNYLGTQPYANVFALVNGLQALTPVQTGDQTIPVTPVVPNTTGETVTEPGGGQAVVESGVNTEDAPTTN